MVEDRQPPRLPVDEGREHLMVQVARMAWQQDRSQTEIAAETGLNRWQVSRLLQEARELGIVRIEIVPRLRRRPDVEATLVKAFGLRDAMVVPATAGPDAVAQAAGQYLAAIKPQPRLVGVSWGRTMAAIAHWLPPDWADGVQVVQINGTVAPIPQATGHNEVAETFARRGRGTFVPLPVPAVVGERVTREVLERDRIVADVLSLARSAPVLCFSMGALTEDAALVQSGNVTAAEIAALARAGAVGDVLGRYVDARGNIVDENLDARTIGLSLSDLKASARAIGVVSGQDKHRITLAALRAGLVNVVVTDEETAAYALEHVHDR
ncbi:sugar-binding transcriptional regulator [Rubellimicrobium roseum]|uniref:Sugar-binding transcriptional regulator n=1 Tax=Rubellimicrobium roseum TaxID=687525 RepID=A0A5C4NF01_9RHOB|nr:sugar-binding transcriptional regulator [Rubellimicrobium roseum]TNC72742.1 sugar-binding transcriptional regulator [Rubellimicrobium roseum]